MKQSPELTQAQHMMESGKAAGHTYLGDDRRPLRAIIETDNERIGNLGITHEEIADRLQFFRDKAREALGTPVILEEVFEVVFQDVRGKLPCPWPHPGLHRKTVTTLKRIDTGESIAWTDLNIHFIKAHGFYEGAGAVFRLDPEKIAALLWL